MEHETMLINLGTCGGCGAALDYQNVSRAAAAVRDSTKQTAATMRQQFESQERRSQNLILITIGFFFAFLFFNVFGGLDE